MEIEKTPIDGVLLIKPKVWNDERGYLLETWHQKRYGKAGIFGPFVQDNTSKSSKGILRGLHYQKQHPQGKLVMVSFGKVFDIAVDIRKNSITFGKWHGTFLSDENHNQLWIAPGLAHGFLVLSDFALFHYKCTDYYFPEDEGTIRWDDPDLNIKWPLKFAPIISQKDSIAPSFKDYCKEIEN